MQNQSKLTGNRPWTPEEDEKLRQQMNRTVKPNWKTVARESGLNRCASSCRYRWIDHLEPRTRPDRKLTDEEKLLIVEFRLEYGKNCWSEITKHLLRGRRIIDVKNYGLGLVNMAKRKGRDVEQHLFEKRVQLVETIIAAGKFTMDYSSSIGAVAYEKLKELLPDLPVAEAAGSSSISSPSDHGLATSSGATDTGAASCYYVEFESDRVGFSDVGPTEEVDQVMILEALGFNPTEINNPEQQLNSGTLVGHGGGPTGFNQVPAAFYTTPNQGWSQTQDSAPPWNFTFVDAPQFHVAWEPNQQLVFNNEDFDGKATAAHSATLIRPFYFY